MTSAALVIQLQQIHRIKAFYGTRPQLFQGRDLDTEQIQIHYIVGYYGQTKNQDRILDRAAC